MGGSIKKSNGKQVIPASGSTPDSGFPYLGVFMASKMYILIKDDVDLGHAILAAAHASLSGYLTFLKQEHSTRILYHGESLYDIPTKVEIWEKESFRKVVCKVSQKEFDKSKTYFEEGIGFRIMNECGIEGNPEVAIVFAPRDEWPNFFKSLKLYK